MVAPGMALRDPGLLTGRLIAVRPSARGAAGLERVQPCMGL